MGRRGSGPRLAGGLVVRAAPVCADREPQQVDGTADRRGARLNLRILLDRRTTRRPMPHVMRGGRRLCRSDLLELLLGVSVAERRKMSLTTWL